MELQNKQAKNIEWVDTSILDDSYAKYSAQIVGIVGWIKSNRNNGSIGFVAFQDGTTFNQIQVVYRKNLSNFEEIKSLRTGCSISVVGKVVLTPEADQPFEIQASNVSILKDVASDYPIQKKNHSDEFLRQNAHLRVRTNKYFAIMKIRSELAYSIHLFFKNNGFIYLQSPIITSNDPEGAGEAFVLSDDKNNPFWPDKALLTVSGQFGAEAYAQAFKRVYTFGPTFRAEKSHTNRHLAEFWMVEPEVAFMNLNQLMILMESFIKHSIGYIKKFARKELDFCNQIKGNSLYQKLDSLLKNEFKKITYTEAIEILKKAVENNHLFEDNNIYWGMNLASEHERYLCERAFGTSIPIFIYNYPKQIKAFYMKVNADNQTVAAVDLLVPGIGELCGGSQREDNKEALIGRCKEMKIDTKNIDWYIQMRDYGYSRSSGFGLGFDRFVMFITGVDNLKDAIPFPRAHGLLNF